jgi:hypothetical protein
MNLSFKVAVLSAGACEDSGGCFMRILLTLAQVLTQTLRSSV